MDEVVKIFAWVTAVVIAVVACYYFVSPYQNCKKDLMIAHGQQYQLNYNDVLTCHKFTTF